METSPSKASRADLSGLRIDRSETREGSGGARGRRIVLAIVALALLVAGGALFAQRSGTFAPRVSVAQVRLRAGGGPAAILTANGYVVAQRKAAVASKATGRLAELFVEEGSVVKTGDILGRLEHADYDADVAKARAEYESGVARVVHDRRDSTFKQTEYDRQCKLLEAGLTTQSTFDRAKNDLDLIALQLNEDEAMVRSLKGALDFALANQEYTNIRAPFDATVLRKNAEIGEIVAPVSVGGASARGAIVDDGRHDVARSRGGRERSLHRAHPDRSGRRDPTRRLPEPALLRARAADRADGGSPEGDCGGEGGVRRARPLRAARDGREGDVPGSAGGGRTAPTPPMQVFVPKEAITERDGRGAVLVVEKGRVRSVAVETGVTDGGEVEIRSGLRGRRDGRPLAGRRSRRRRARSQCQMTASEFRDEENRMLDHIVETRGFVKHYQRDGFDIPVLDGIDLDVDEGDFYALMGPSGSGKTTLLNLIGGIDKPTSGTLIVAEQDISKLSDKALARWRSRHIGFIFQLYNLIPVLTALQNVELPLLLTKLSRRGAQEARDARARHRRARGPGEPLSRASSRAGRSSASRSRARSCPIPRCCSPTSRPAISTPRRREEILDPARAAQQRAQEDDHHGDARSARRRARRTKSVHLDKGVLTK